MNLIKKVSPKNPMGEEMPGFEKLKKEYCPEATP
jgi:hypothetical protein